MNFRLIKSKAIPIILFGGIISLARWGGSLYGGLGKPPQSLFTSIKIWLIASIIIYLIWSLFQKNIKD